MKKVLIHFFQPPHITSAAVKSFFHLVMFPYVKTHSFVDVFLFAFTLMIKMLDPSATVYNMNLISDYLQKHLLLSVHKEPCRLCIRRKSVNISSNEIPAPAVLYSLSFLLFF